MYLKGFSITKIFGDYIVFKCEPQNAKLSAHRLLVFRLYADRYAIVEFNFQEPIC